MNYNTYNLQGLLKAASTAMSVTTPNSTTAGSGVGSVKTNAAVLPRKAKNPLPGPLDKEGPKPKKPIILANN